MEVQGTSHTLPPANTLLLQGGPEGIIRICSSSPSRQGSSRHTFSGRTVDPGVLQSPIPPTEAFGRVQAHHRPVQTEQFHRVPALQDGNSTVHPGKSSAGGMVHTDRHQGCLSTHSGPTQFPQVPALHSIRKSVSVQNSSVRFERSSSYIHSGPETGPSSLTKPTHPSPRLSGRLDSQGATSSPNATVDTHDPELISRTGVGYQLGQKHARPDPTVCFSGAAFQHSHSECKPGPQGPGEPQHSHSQPVSGQHSHSQKLIVSIGQDQALGTIHVTRETTAPQGTGVAQTPLDTRTVQLGETYPSGHSLSQIPALVDTHEEHYSGRPTTSTLTHSGHVHGCMQYGLGCTPRKPDCQGHLATSHCCITHQQTGTQSCLSSLLSIQSCPSGNCHTCTYRQHHCCCLHPQGGRHKVDTPDEGCHTAIELVRPSQSHTHTCTHCGCEERRSRPTVTCGPASEFRVEPLTVRIQDDPVSSGVTDPGPFRHGGEQSHQGILLTDSPPGSTSSRCTQPELAEGAAPIRLPTHCISPASSPEGPTVSGYQSDSDSVNVINQSLARRSPISINSGSPSSCKSTTHTLASPVRRDDPAVPLTTGTIQSGSMEDTVTPLASRLDSLSSIMQLKEVPATVIPYAIKPQRTSTASLYDKQWDTFSKFCSDNKGINPLNSTESTVAEYLVSMFENGAQPATIKVHRAAIQSVLIHKIPDIANSVIIRNCIRSFDIERPRTRRVLPKFDINLVLWQFLKPPFTNAKCTSDREIPLEIYVCKLSFLLALACGSRSSELHALTRSPGSLSRESEGGALHSRYAPTRAS